LPKSVPSHPKSWAFRIMVRDL